VRTTIVAVSETPMEDEEPFIRLEEGLIRRCCKWLLCV